MATKKKTSKDGQWPRVQTGSHLTVYTYEDGSTKLEWDDKILLQEIRDAVKIYETTEQPTKPRRAKKVILT